MFKRTLFRYLWLLFFICFGMFLIFPSSNSFSQDLNPGEVMQVKVNNDFLSVKLENAPIQEVLREIARQTDLKFEGLENAEGKVTQEFENIPLDEGLRKISQSFIMIFKKSGETGDALRVEKVIIIAKKGMSEATPDSKSDEESRPLIASPSKVTSSIPQSATPSQSLPPKSREITPSIPESEAKKSPISEPEVKKSEMEETEAQEKVKKSAVPEPEVKKSSIPEREIKKPEMEEIKAEEKVKAKIKEVVATPEKAVITAPEKEQEKKKEQAASRQIERTKNQSKAAESKKQAASIPPKVAKETASVAIKKPIPSSSSVSSDLSQGEKYFKEKRWDRAVKYFKKYLEQNPSDLETEKRYTIAQQNTDEAISLYNQAKKLEKEEEFKDAYEYYKKSYDIYPLLYDTWERMQSIKKKMNK